MTKSDKQFLIIISSPSGAGKTTICKRLLKMDKFLKVSISDTTRPPRSNEVEGKDYNFIDEKEFKDRIEKDLYAEFANVFGNCSITFDAGWPVSEITFARIAAV